MGEVSSAVETLPTASLPARVFWGLHQRRLLIILLFVGVFAYNLVSLTDIDFWWHLKTGELIATTGVIPTADPFSYTVPGRPWVAHEWLWELATYWVYRFGGYGLATLLSAVIVTAAYAILYRLLRRLGTNEFVATALVLWAAMLVLPGVGVRPRQLTLLFLAFYVSRLFLYREGRLRHLWALPPLMLLWVNVHGLFILGLGVLGLFTLDALARWLLDRREKAPQHLAAVTLAATVAACFNPRGPAILRYPIDYYLQAHNPSFAHVTEFQSPNFHEPINLLFAASIVLMAVIPRPFDRRTFLEVTLVIVFTLEALISVRQIAAYVIVIPPLLVPRLRDRFALAGELPPPSLPRRLIVLNWLLLVASLGMGATYASQPAVQSRLQLSREPLANFFPVAGARYIQDHDLPGPVFNEQMWGGYLIYQWYPHRRVFIDGRIDMYSNAVVRDYGDVVTLAPDWRDVLDRYGVRTILIVRDSPLSEMLLASGEWRRVFQGDVEDVFVRRGTQ